MLEVLYHETPMEISFLKHADSSPYERDGGCEHSIMHKVGNRAEAGNTDRALYQAVPVNKVALDIPAYHTHVPNLWQIN